MGRVFSLILLLLFLVGGVYTVIQYMNGYNSAKGEIVTSSEFTGDTWNDGDRENTLVLGIDSQRGRTISHRYNDACFLE